MSITVDSIVFEVSNQLNDQGIVPYTRWSRATLITYLNDALIQVGTFRPDAYSQTIQSALVAGSEQLLPVGYSMLKSIDYNAAASNCPNAPITETNLDLLRAFFKKPCLPSGGASTYRVLSFAYDPRNPRVFYVSPPVPADAAGTQVSLTLVADAPAYTAADTTTPIGIDQKYKNALIAWMEMRAYEVDTESVTSRQTKLDCEGLFWKTLGINYKQESAYKSGWYLGQRGSQDPNSSRH